MKTKRLLALTLPLLLLTSCGNKTEPLPGVDYSANTFITASGSVYFYQDESIAEYFRLSPEGQLFRKQNYGKVYFDESFVANYEILAGVTMHYTKETTALINGVVIPIKTEMFYTFYTDSSGARHMKSVSENRDYRAL